MLVWEREMKLTQDGYKLQWKPKMEEVTMEEAIEWMLFQKEQVLAMSDDKPGPLTVAYDMAIEALRSMGEIEEETQPQSRGQELQKEDEEMFEWEKRLRETQSGNRKQTEQEEKPMEQRERSVDTGNREKIYLRMPKSFVRKDVQSQKEGQEGKTYNKVTLPKNAKIAGNDIGGFSFYPLYVNDDKYSENLYNIPLLADQQVQLNKNGEKIMASPAEIKAAVEDSYKEYQMGARRHEKQAQEAKAYEFAWEGLSFREYCLQRISDSLDTLKGETVAKENMAAAVKDNATHIPDTYESTKFIGRHIQEAQQIHDNYAAEGRSLPNPLEKPEEFQVHMVNAGIDACLAESKYLKEQTNNITLDDKTVDLVKADVGIKPSKKMEKQMSKKISKDKGIDLE